VICDRRKKVDIVVVGAGPAGSMAARYAAQGGRSVCLLEKNSAPSDPVRCGEGIGIKGLHISMEPKPEWILSKIEVVQMHSPSDKTVRLESSNNGYILNRELFDNDLVAQARHYGAQYFPHTPALSVRERPGGSYTVKTPSAEFSARCVIIADGVASKTARDLGWDTSLALDDVECCAFARIESPAVEEGAIHFYIGSTWAPGGFVWIFDRGGGSANVGLGILGSRTAPGMPKKMLEHFIQTQLPDATVSHIHCGGVPVARWTRPLVRHGALLVGDAARMVNCVNGGGLSYALYAGKQAGIVASQAFSKGKFNARHLKKYEKIWASRLGKQQRRSFALKKMIVQFSDDTLDRIAETVTRSKKRRLNYLDVFLTAFSRNPLMMVRSFLLLR
jgi:digeranylgeranylglycerophospholipid reductase